MPARNSKETCESGSEEKSVSESKRNSLKLGLGLGILFAAAGMSAVGEVLMDSTPPGESISTLTSEQDTDLPSLSSQGFPVILVANLSDLTNNGPIWFNYPLEETPNILVKLGQEAQNGVGPENDIVAFSAICQHLGCIWGFVKEGSSPPCNSSFKLTDPVGYCCCHGSTYDLVDAGKVIGGPAPKPAPQVILDFDSASGNVFAIGMRSPTIFGYPSDLENGTLVS